MADPVVAEVIKSGARLYNAPVGETQPDETTVAFNAAWGGNWVRVGYTAAPLVMVYETEEYDVEVEEHLSPIRRWRVKENLRLETTLAQLTAAYLQLAVANQTGVTSTAAGAGQAAYEETGLGDVAKLAERAWGFEGMYLSAAGTEFAIRLFVYKGTAFLNGNLEFSQKSTAQTGIPVQIKVLTDPTQTAGKRLCLFQRVTAAATA